MNDNQANAAADDLYRRASQKTAENLESVAKQVSHLTLPEIDATVDLVSRIVPAGNVPGVILNGLARLSGRRPPRNILRRDVKLLFDGVEQILDKAVFGAVFAGPAAVIWGYQNLLKLAGKDPEEAFYPEGTWQFYVDYALREDTARHATETHGFDTILAEHGIMLDQVDRMTAWVMASMHILHLYDDLLENEWRERVYTYILRQTAAEQQGGDPLAKLYQQWVDQRPYGRGSDTAFDETYADYRRRKFDDYMAHVSKVIDQPILSEWQARVQLAEEDSLADYQNQLSIHAHLEPGSHGENRVPIAFEDLRVGVVYRGQYYLLPIQSRESEEPPNVEQVRRWIAAILGSPAGEQPANLTQLVQVNRKALSGLRSKLNKDLRQSLDSLRNAPILLNFDPHSHQLPLSELRQDERGVGDHALTVFNTGKTMVFDQSHIFFDGAWGAALAEIMTNEALSWAVYLSTLQPARAGKKMPPRLRFPFTEKDLDRIGEAPTVLLEVGVENHEADLRSLQRLRQVFKQRSDLLELTVNDLLVLFRAIHAVTYQLPDELRDALKALTRGDDPAAATAAQTALETIIGETAHNPAILIPVDASPRAPRDRVYPMSFEVPLEDLDLIGLYERTMDSLERYDEASGDRSQIYAEFDELQRTYLATLAGFGEVMSEAKRIAIAGESAAVGTIKLLAHMPTPLQRILDAIPSRFDMLNDIIKGREVFSNVGQVVQTSTLTRFITAKDDNEKKTLAWGVLTDADGVMHLSLRDFRPHVGMLIEAGQRDLAREIAQDYLNVYVYNLNMYIKDVWRITVASRETRMQRPEDL